MVDPTSLERIVNDPYTQFLGATLEVVEPGFCRASLTVTQEMLNFHRITHGGIVFSLGDIAFAAASNAAGQKALAMNVTVSFLRPTGVGDLLLAEAREIESVGTAMLYEISVTEKKRGQRVASFQALAFRKTR